MAKSDDKADIWMPLYIGDYLADTSRLTTEQHGAYLLLMMDYWRVGPPPDDDEILQNVTRLSKFLWTKSRPVLEKFFTIENGQWHHKRIDEELAKAQAGSSAASDKARKAAEARWGKKDAPSISQAYAPDLLEECPSQSQSQSSKKHLSSVKPDDTFDRFWSAWPSSDRKTAKAKCSERWVKARLSGEVDAIVAHVEASKVMNRQWRDGFEPAPLTYLNQRRWEDGEGEPSNDLPFAEAL